MSSTSTSSRLLSYGSVALGATTLLSGNSEAATVIDINATSFDTGLSSIGTVSLSSVPFGAYTFKGQVNFAGGLVGTAGDAFQRAGSGVSFVPDSSTDATPLIYANGFGGNNGAVSGSDNWLYAVSTTDSNQRVWLQFNFSTPTSPVPAGTILRAVFPSSVDELPTAQLAFAAVPEPSALALLSMGAGGLLLRRRRRAA